MKRSIHPNPTATIQKGTDTIVKYHSMVNQVTNWPLESEKEVQDAFRYFAKTWIPAAGQHLSTENYSDAVVCQVYSSRSFLILLNSTNVKRC